MGVMNLFFFLTQHQVKLTSCGSVSVSPSNLSSALGLPKISFFTCEPNNHVKLITTRWIRFNLKIPHLRFLAVCWEHWGHESITAGRSIGPSDRTVSQSWEQDHAGLHPIRAQRLKVDHNNTNAGVYTAQLPLQSNCTLAPSSGDNLYRKEIGNTINTPPILYILHHIQPQNYPTKQLKKKSLV